MVILRPLMDEKFNKEIYVFVYKVSNDAIGWLRDIIHIRLENQSDKSTKQHLTEAIPIYGLVL